MQIGSASHYAAPFSSLQMTRSPASEPAGQPSHLSGATTSRPTAAEAEQNAASTSASASSSSSARDVHQQRIDELKLAQLASRDREVRAHEQAHASVGGAYAGAPSYTFKGGSDGKRYAIGGEVGIDTSAVPNDPAATVRKMEVVIRAALAPAEPSSQDRRVAAQATVRAAQARVELAQQQREEAVAAAEARAEQRAAREAQEQGDASREPEATQQGAMSAPKLDVYLSLSQLQSPEPVVDLSV